MEYIIITDAHEHNLKHLDLKIPLNAFTCVTGCSGCGKSSLVFDTVYAECQRGFLEGMTGNVFGQKLMDKPSVGSVENLRPALNISQNYYNVNPRSTIGTITEISYYLRSLFALLNSGNRTKISEGDFSANNPKSFCPYCMGLGVENSVSVELLVPDKEKRLCDGAILYFKGPSEGKEMKTLEGLCEYYGIDVSKKYSELNAREIFALMQSEEKIKYKVSYKEGKRRKQHYVFLQGAISAINERLAHSDGLTGVAYSKYLEEVPCHICHGARLKPEILEYKVNGLNIYEVECMEFVSLRKWLKNFLSKSKERDCNGFAAQLLENILRKLDLLINIDVGYLSLNRSIPSLSGGETQRVRIANQLACPLKGLVYIMDEPCKGLHYKDISKIVNATRSLVDNGNTVISIEHNKQYISAADRLLELGPVGGPDGGYIIENKAVRKCLPISLRFKSPTEMAQYVKLRGINYRNIVNQDICFPVGGITCITGVSGSGKSTLSYVVMKCFERGTAYNCQSFENWNSIKRVISVNQAPIGKTPRSSIVSYLGIYDAIRNLFADTTYAKRLRLNASSFSMNVGGGRCELCQGTGLQKIELNYLPSSYITCPECGGKRFTDKVLSVIYKGKSIIEVLETPIDEILSIFQDVREIHSVLSSMIELGLGYLKLGQMSMNLSGGEAQRIKLARALGAITRGRNLYILDEPTSGLNSVDVDKFEKILMALQKNGETILIVEHNVEFVSHVADWIIDFGSSGGAAGGRIAFQGHPREAFKCLKSSLNGIPC